MGHELASCGASRGRASGTRRGVHPLAHAVTPADTVAAERAVARIGVPGCATIGGVAGSLLLDEHRLEVERQLAQGVPVAVVAQNVGIGRAHATAGSRPGWWRVVGSRPRERAGRGACGDPCGGARRGSRTPSRGWCSRSRRRRSAATGGLRRGCSSALLAGAVGGDDPPAARARPGAAAGRRARPVRRVDELARRRERYLSPGRRYPVGDDWRYLGAFAWAAQADRRVRPAEPAPEPEVGASPARSSLRAAARRRPCSRRETIDDWLRGRRGEGVWTSATTTIALQLRRPAARARPRSLLRPFLASVAAAAERRRTARRVPDGARQFPGRHPPWPAERPRALAASDRP